MTLTYGGLHNDQTDYDLHNDQTVSYAIPKVESTSICHGIISKCKYICLRMTSAIQAKLACVKSISLLA